MAFNPTVYCLDQVTDYAEFERLCDDLMALEGYPNIEPLGGFKDKGRDAVHIDKKDGVSTVFAYSVREDWRAKLSEDAEKIDRHGHECDRMVFVTTAGVSAGQRDEAMEFIADRYGWKLELYPVERLRIMLEATHPQVRSHYPQIFPPFIYEAWGKTALPEQRDHILILYSPEDKPLADWLARKLTSEGYLVWYDGFRGIGAEHFPDNVDDAIQNSVACLISLYSIASLNNPDIIRQQMIGLTVDRQRPHFFIPLRIDPIPVERLDQITRQLIFVPFEKDWAEGLRRLLERLSESNFPRSLLDGKGIASQTFTGNEFLSLVPEQLVSNCFPIVKLPEKIFRFVPTQPLLDDQYEMLKKSWAFKSLRDGGFLSFHHPPDTTKQIIQFRETGSFFWQTRDTILRIDSANLATELIRKSLMIACYQKGLSYCPETRLIYFPSGLVEGDKIHYQWPNGQRASIKVTGERKYPHGKKEYYRYYLSPDFWVSRNLTEDFTALLRVRIRISDITGVPLSTRGTVSRRKALSKDWWNREWLSRILAVCQFIAGGDLIKVGTIPSERVEISVTPIMLTATRGINEDGIVPDNELREEMINLWNDDEDELPGGGANE